jgi:two-component system sensor histidine kinase MprB
VSSEPIARDVTSARRVSLPTFSLRRRIAMLVAVAVFGAVLLVSVGAWLVIHRELTEQTDATLRNEATAVGNAQIINPDMQARQLCPLVLTYQVVQNTGVVKKPCPQTVSLPVESIDIAVARGQSGMVLRDIDPAGTHLRMITYPYYSGGALQIAQNLDGQDEALHKFAVLLFAISIGGAVLAAALGVGIARAGLSPVRDLTAAAERIARTDDLAPLTLSGYSADDDEVARLAGAFNIMLASLARSRQRQRQLIADAGHELRTPLTSMRTNLELLAREDPASGRVLPPDDRARLLADLTAQAEELSTLVGDLTAIAREDEPGPVGQEYVDLAEVARRAVARARRRAPQVTVVTDLHFSPVRGRPQLLERAVTNLLDNALKWTPAGADVFVGLRDGALVVADQGPGIADEDLPHVFERFYRARSARELPGSGLGLAIVAQTVEEHGGTVSAEQIPEGGTLMRLTIPLAESAQD